jgi:hypothetical protein
MTTTFTYELRAEFDPGQEPLSVVTDQRDVAAWEIQPFGCPVGIARSRMFTFLRFICWHALKRQGALEWSWEKFDKRCALVQSVEVERAEGAEGPADPGPTAPPAVTS